MPDEVQILNSDTKYQLLKTDSQHRIDLVDLLLDRRRDCKPLTYNDGKASVPTRCVVTKLQTKNHSKQTNLYDGTQTFLWGLHN